MENKGFCRVNLTLEMERIWLGVQVLESES